VVVTDIVVTAVRATPVLAACAVSLDDVQALAQMCVWVDSVHVKDTAAPVLALAVHTVPAPEPVAVTVVAAPAAAHAGGAENAPAPETKQVHTAPDIHPVYAADRAPP